MIDKDDNREVTRGDIVLAVATLALFLVPMALLTLFPDVELVQTVFGSGRMFLFWIVLALVVFVYHRSIDKWFDTKFGRSRPRRNN